MKFIEKTLNPDMKEHIYGAIRKFLDANMITGVNDITCHVDPLGPPLVVIKNRDSEPQSYIMGMKHDGKKYSMIVRLN